MGMNQEDARRLFDSSGFLLVTGLPKGSEFGIDGLLWQVDRFSGVKFIPPGLHMFIVSSASNSSKSMGPNSDNETLQSLPAGIGIRHALFKIYKGKEVIVKEWDESLESLKDPSSSSVASKSTSTSETKRSKTNVPETIISKEHLQTLDPELAPFPFSNRDNWKSLACFIDEYCVGRVMRKNEEDDALVHSVTPSIADFKGMESEGTGKGKVWKRSKHTESIEEVLPEDSMPNSEETNKNQGASDEIREECLKYADFDLKRSWRKGATGEELTRDSLDKTDLLRRIIANQWNNDPNQLLSEIQLSFIMFLYVYNFSSLDIYKQLISLLSHSQSLFQRVQPPSSSSPSSLSSYTLPLTEVMINFLSKVFPSQLKNLREEIFQQELPGLDTFLIEQLIEIRKNLRAFLQTSSTKDGTPASRKENIPVSDYADSEDENVETTASEPNQDELVKRLRVAWNTSREVAAERFNWILPSLDVPQTTTRRTTGVDRTQISMRAPGYNDSGGKLYYDLWREDRGEDDEYVEMGEDAPILVLDAEVDNLPQESGSAFGDSEEDNLS